MCGVVGYVGPRDAVPVLLDGLARLEYRGYDSAGVAVLNGRGVETRKLAGRIAALRGRLAQDPIHGTCGIGHTRWATHGAPTERNAHPHTDCTGALAQDPVPTRLEQAFQPARSPVAIPDEERQRHPGRGHSIVHPIPPAST